MRSSLICLSLYAFGAVTLPQMAMAQPVDDGVGAYAGISLKMELGQNRQPEPVMRLTAAPQFRQYQIDGSSRLYVSQGVGLRLTADQPVAELGGLSLAEWDQLGRREDDPQLGMSDTAKVAIGVAVVAVVVGGVIFWNALENASD